MRDISANSKSELLNQLAAVDIDFPSPGEYRTKVQIERWSAFRLLSTLAKLDRLAYPLKAQGRDRPDYLVSLPSGTVGIEITEAVPTSLAWANARRNGCDHEKLVMLEKFFPGEPLRSKAEIDLIAQGGNAGSGWGGDAVERQFAEVMIHFALQKKEKFGKKGYAMCDKNWLVIYKHWPLPNLNETQGAVYLSQKLSELNEPLPFEKIFVECSNAFWEFSGSSAACLEINDLWNDS